MREQTDVEGTAEFVKHAPEYEETKGQLTKAANVTQQARVAGDHATAAQIDEAQAANWYTWFTQRWYAVPVLARGQTLRFTYMTKVVTDTAPVGLFCQRAGVRVKHKQPYQTVWYVWRIPLAEAAFAGVIIGTLVWLAVISSVSTLWLAALLCLVVGLLGNVPGAAVVKCYRWLRDRLIG